MFLKQVMVRTALSVLSEYIFKLCKYCNLFALFTLLPSRFCLCSLCAHLENVLTIFPLSGGCSEGLDAFRIFFKNHVGMSFRLIITVGIG